MSDSVYTYLRFVPFSCLHNWSVQYYSKHEYLFKEQFISIQLKNLLKRVKDTVDIIDDIKYKRVSIRLYNCGIIPRNEEFGSNKKTIYNKTRTVFNFKN